MALSATAAYRVLPWLSIGAGPSPGHSPTTRMGEQYMGAVVGSYSPDLIYAVGLNLIWRF